MKAIPKRLHIIWIGGDIPARNRECITSFTKLNPDWEINLWIDANQLLTGERRQQISERYKAAHNGAAVPAAHWQQSADTLGERGGDNATIDYLETYLGRRGEALEGKRSRNANSIMMFCEANRIKLREVQRDLKIGKNAPIYRQELVNRGGNFGAASDILRIEILLQHGGIYVDTDIRCVQALGEIICHQSYPRFSSSYASASWKTVDEQGWNSDEWWQRTVTGADQPQISNSVIASHAGCRGLTAYKSLIHSNYKALKKPGELRDLYAASVRHSTVKMTGPTAAAESSGFKKIRDAFGDRQLQSPDAGQRLEDSRFLRDNWYFPMYKVRDQYFHDWL
ncbi:TcdA/TcdB catalytic glycosyltransferase domain-containing protein [Burkholderia sp. 3C]